MTSITKYIENKLLLKVNRSKSKVSRPTHSKLLGFSFYKTTKEWSIRIAKELIMKLKAKVKSITARNNGTNISQKIEKLKPIIYGWVGYFR